ncbi:MAG: hypothetical protein IJ270_06260 [Paludibacteraceae bacterium]|nr:hypothetical protein [Paludibacteraceae bacterium]
MKEQYKIELIKQIGEMENRSPQSLKVFLDRNTREDLILKYQQRCKILKIVILAIVILACLTFILLKDPIIISIMLLYIALSIALRIEILKHKINLYKLLLALEKEE